MSNATYTAAVNSATDALNEQLEYEQLNEPALKSADRRSAIEQTATSYVRYIRIFQRLETAYDQMVHPQKRLVLRATVDAVLGRLLEMKHELVSLEAADMHNYADVLMDLKLNHEDIELPVPKYTMAERGEKIQARDALLERFSAKSVEQFSAPAQAAAMRIEDAVKVLQINERGRQARQRAKYMRDIKLRAEREKEFDEKNDEGAQVKGAALQIQRIWKGYRTRKRWAGVVEQENIFLGMDYIKTDPKTSPVAKADANSVRRKVVQKQFEEEYRQAMIDIKEKIRTVEGPDIKEGFQDSFRRWYMEYRREQGKLPDFPSDKHWQMPTFKFGQPDPDLEMQEAAKAAAEKDRPAAASKKAAAAKGKDAKGKKKGKDKEGKGKSKKSEAPEPEEGDPADKVTPYQMAAKESNRAYAVAWKSRDESENFAQRHDPEIIKNDKRKEVEAEIKLDVFELLKEELRNLKMAVEKTKGRKGKKKKGKGKKGKKAKKGGKKEKGKKGKKGKKDKDLTAGRPPEELFEELTRAGIIQKHAPVYLKDFLGDANVMAKDDREVSLVELRRLMTEYAVLPLDFNNVGTTLPCVGSLLVFGAKGTGKTMLAKAVATETGATFFNLSPKNTAGQYAGKAGTTKMMHMVFKVARLYAPSVVYIDGAEMVFAKKVPKDDASDPKRIKKDLIRYCKGIKAQDHVIVIGCSCKPWDADLKALASAFPRQAYVPKPDYGSRELLWKVAIGRISPAALKRHVNSSILARLSDGVTAGGIFTTAKMVLTERRLKMVRYRPLTTSEFLNCMSSNVPLNLDENKLFKDWTAKLPLSKKWLALTNPPEDDGAGKRGEKGKDKEKKGAKKPAAKKP